MLTEKVNECVCVKERYSKQGKVILSLSEKEIEKGRGDIETVTVTERMRY
jgi:hypothetical protein